MPQGKKLSYTENRHPQERHDAPGDRERDLREAETDRRAWAAANNMADGGKHSTLNRGRKENPDSYKSDRVGGGISAGARTFLQRSLSAKKAAQTRARNQAQRRLKGE